MVLVPVAVECGEVLIARSLGEVSKSGLEEFDHLVVVGNFKHSGHGVSPRHIERSAGAYVR